MKKTIIYLFLVFVVIFTSCKEEIIINNNDFTISSESPFLVNDGLSFTGNTSKAVIYIATKENSLAWGIKCSLDDQWCTYAKDGKYLIVTATNNNTQTVRQSVVTIVVGENEKEISITQDYIRKIYFIDSELTVGASGGEKSIVFESNIDNADLLLSSDCDWITNISANNNILTFSISKHLVVDTERVGVITVAYENLSVNVTITQKALSGYPYKIPIDDIDLTTYPVYEIWDNVHSVKVGEICEEFLYKPEVVKERLIVAYPCISGNIDYTRGFVVSNGGSVSWSESFISSYIAGEASTLPDTLYIGIGDNEISATPFSLDESEKSMVVVTKSEPMMVVDERNGAANSAGETEESFTYTVQKIGLQYWMRENLRTTRFRDGTNIPTGVSNTEWGNMCKSSLLPACKVCYSSTHRYLDANDPNASEIRKLYGVNYDWAAIINDTLDVASTSELSLNVEDKISPKGWSIPTREEFFILYSYMSQGALSTSVYFPFMIEKGEAENQNVSGLCGNGGQWGSAKGGYNAGIYFGTLGYGYITLSSDINTTGHIQTVASLRLDKTQTITEVNVGCAVYLRCIKK